MEVKKYRKKPVVIEAMLFKGVDSIREAMEFVGDSFEIGSSSHDGEKYEWVVIYIKTLEGDMNVSDGDYIIKGVQGEFYPCKPDIFEATYEELLTNKTGDVE